MPLALQILLFLFSFKLKTTISKNIYDLNYHHSTFFRPNVKKSGLKNVISIGKFLLREAIEKNYEILTLGKKGGRVSTAAKLFIKEKYGLVLRGRGVAAPRSQ